MKVIFTQVSGASKVDDVKNVKNGYARYLLRYNRAQVATPELIALSSERIANRVKNLNEIKVKAQEIANSLKNIVLEFNEKTSGTHLYGSVGEANIVEKLLEVAKIEVKKEQIKMESHIKTVGDHIIILHLAEGVEVKIKVKVNDIEESKS